MKSPRTLLLTGASSGIGRAIITSLLAEPYRILAHYHHSDPNTFPPATEVCSVIPIQGDLSSEQGVRSFMSALKEVSEIPDSWVHLPARKLHYERVQEVEPSDLSLDFDLQVISALRLAQMIFPLAARQKARLRVVFTLSSVTLGVPPKNLLRYTLSKYALLGLMRGLASEYAGTNIVVNGVSPSMVETDFLSEAPKKLVEIAAAKHPLGRNAVPTDIVPMILFLLSPGADYISGVNFPITGGQTL